MTLCSPGHLALALYLLFGSPTDMYGCDDNDIAHTFLKIQLARIIRPSPLNDKCISIAISFFLDLSPDKLLD